MHRRFQVVFFVDQKEYNPVFEYMINKPETDLIILINVIQRLGRDGLDLIDTNMAKRLRIKNLFELRKDRHRIIFSEHKPGCFILLHAFLKETQKTPRKHIERAKRNYTEHDLYGKHMEFSFPTDD